MRNVENMAKCRGYIPDSNCWVVGNLITDGSLCMIHNKSGDKYIVDNDKVCHSTTKNDIDGKEIFEGDILICVNKHTFISKMGLVIWNNIRLAFEVIDNAGDPIPCAWTECDLKVVGTKYFDKHLLKHTFEN